MYRAPQKDLDFTLKTARSRWWVSRESTWEILCFGKIILVSVCRGDLKGRSHQRRRLSCQPGHLDGGLGESGGGCRQEELEGFLRDLEGRADQGWGGGGEGEAVAMGDLSLLFWSTE